MLLMIHHLQSYILSSCGKLYDRKRIKIISHQLDFRDHVSLVIDKTGDVLSILQS